MSKVCVLTGKKPQVGNNVSHAHNKTRRRWLPNIQKKESGWQKRNVGYVSVFLLVHCAQSKKKV